MFRTRGIFFFFILFARAFAPFAFNFLTLSRFFFRGLWERVKNLGTQWVPLCVCVFVCVRGQSPRLNFHVKRILKHHRFVRFSFRFAFCAPCSEYISYSFIFPFTDPFSLHLSHSLSVWTKKFVRQSFCLLLLVMARWCKNNLKLFSNIFYISFHTRFDIT